jgi:hypothetical protein
VKPRPFCSPECRDNAGWLLDADGRPLGRCRCRLDPKTVAQADEMARSRLARYNPEEND